MRESVEAARAFGCGTHHHPGDRGCRAWTGDRAHWKANSEGILAKKSHGWLAGRGPPPAPIAGGLVEPLGLQTKGQGLMPTRNKTRLLASVLCPALRSGGSW